MAKSGLTPVVVDGVPCFSEAKTTLICRTLFARPFDPAGFVDPSVVPDCYPEKDFHTLYVAEIEKVLTE